VRALRASAAILRASLRRELRTGEALLPMLLFSLVVVLVSGFAFDLPELEAALRDRLVTGILWIAIAFAMIVGQARHLLADRQEERWAGLLLAPIDRTVLFGLKWIEGVLLGVVLEGVLVPLCVVLFDLSLGGRWLPLAAALLVCTAGLAALGTIFGTVVARLGRGEALLAILVLPAAAPVLIAGVRSTEAILEAGTLAAAAPWPTVALTTMVLYAAIGGLLYESVLVD
jgi:heme exporter protein CcmB